MLMTWLVFDRKFCSVREKVTTKIRLPVFMQEPETRGFVVLSYCGAVRETHKIAF